jgi:hypothetical protein
MTLETDKGKTPPAGRTSDTPSRGKRRKAANPWPAYTVEKWPIDRLKPYARNARRHGDRQIEQLRASLRQFGWTMPILAHKNGSVIAGHGRLEAAKAEGYNEIPVIVAIGWTPAQCRAYRLADNKLGETSTWDKDTLDLELADLSGMGVDLKAFGFKPAELDGGAVPDSSPQLDGLSYAIVVRCKDEAHQNELLEQLEKQGLKCEALIS